MPKIDLSAANTEMNSGSVNSLVELGVYEVTVKSAEFSQDDQGRDKLVVDFETGDGDVFRKWLYMHTKDTKRITLDQMSRLGVAENWNPKNTGELVGKECRIEIGRDQSGNYASVEKIYQKYVDPGKYNCVIGDISKQETAYSGKPFRRVFFKILDTGEFQNLRIMDRLYFNDKSLKFTGSKLQAMGASRSDFDTDNDRHMQELVGNYVEITLTIRRGNDGKDYPNVKNIKLLDGPPAVADAANDVIDIPDDVIAGFEEEDEDEIPF
jgi:hypothetical protein